MITWIEHTTPGHPVTGSGSSGPGGEIKAAASGRSNSADEVGRGRRSAPVTRGQVTGWLPKIEKGSRTKIRNPF